MSQYPTDPPDPFTSDPFASASPDRLEPLPSDPLHQPQHAPAYTNPLAIGSLVSGLFAVLLSFVCCCPPIPIIGGFAGLAAILLGVIGLSQIKAGKGGGRGWAISGIISGAVALLLLLAFIGYFLVVQNRNFDDFEWQLEDEIKMEDNLDAEGLELPEVKLIPVEPPSDPQQDGPASETPENSPPGSDPQPTDSTPKPPGG